MTPLESIRHGILTGDMALVAEGYNRISNDKVTLPAKEPVYVERQEYVEPARPQRADGKVGETPARPEPFTKKRRINLFADDGERPLGYSEVDRQADRAAKNKEKVSRPKGYTPISIACTSCGFLYKVNPILVYNGVYNCDKCSNNRRG